MNDYIRQLLDDIITDYDGDPDRITKVIEGLNEMWNKERPW